MCLVSTLDLVAFLASVVYLSLSAGVLLGLAARKLKPPVRALAAAPSHA